LALYQALGLYWKPSNGTAGMFIIHGYQGLGNGPTLVRGQVSSWLKCAERGGGAEGQTPEPVWLPQCDDVLKFWKKLIVKSHTHEIRTCFKI
jgi:hypothetical protein